MQHWLACVIVFDEEHTAMKIMLVTSALSGHNITYLKSLTSAIEAEMVLCIPDHTCDGCFDASRVYISPFIRKGKPDYFQWLRNVKRIVRKERPDIVHFLIGDALYHYFGFGIGSIRAKKVITCHHVRNWSRPARIIYRHISNRADVMVYHTDSLTERMKDIGISNAYHIEYPQFSENLRIEQVDAKRMLGLPDDGTPVILALGGTRFTKGLDILLAALKDVKAPFYLLIAGKEESFGADYIREHSASYRESVFLKLKFLTDEEFALCLSACDIVCLPYRKTFDGASGPLGEGVHMSKMIVGPEHGSLGSIIRNNHLGKTFESENVLSLAGVLNAALLESWEPDEVYRSYQKSLQPELFQEKYRELYLRLMQADSGKKPVS